MINHAANVLLQLLIYIDSCKYINLGDFVAAVECFEVFFVFRCIRRPIVIFPVVASSVRLVRTKP